MDHEYDAKLAVDNFINDCTSILAAAEFTHDAAWDVLEDIELVHQELVSQGYLEESTSAVAPWAYMPDWLDLDEKRAKELRKALDKVLVDVREHGHELHAAWAQKRRPPRKRVSRTYFDTVRYLRENVFSVDSPSDHLAGAKRDLIESLSKTDDGSILERDVETGLPWSTFVDIAAEEAEFRAHRDKWTANMQLARNVKNLSSALNLPNPEAITSPWRQSFITIMARFDATIFDIVRAGFHNDFFRVFMAFVSKSQIKIELKRIADLGSFEKLQTELVNDQLKGKYLRELILTLRGIDVPDVTELEEADYHRLIEVILRRNLHLHNNVVVDQKYLHDAETIYNVDQFCLGDFATIDLEYLSRARRLVITYVQLLAVWSAS
jgi:hypothetical protein